MVTDVELGKSGGEIFRVTMFSFISQRHAFAPPWLNLSVGLVFSDDARLLVQLFKLSLLRFGAALL
jgi:hypothetical protein